MATPMFRRILATLALAFGSAASVQCSAQSGYDGESHFLCSRDTDCASLGTDFRCVERRCVQRSRDRTSADASTAREDAALPTAPPSPLAGYASDGAGGFRFVHVDPTTGKVTFDVPAPDIMYVHSDAAYDDVSGTWFGITGMSGPTDLRLVSIAANTATMLSEPTLNQGVSNIALAKGDLVGVQTTTPGVVQFGALDANVGAFTPRSTMQGGPGFDGASRTDAAARVYYILTPKADTNLLSTLRTLDVATGKVLHDVTTVEELTDIEVDANGRVLGFVFWPATNELVAVDPATGATTFVAALPQVQGTASGSSAIDRNASIVYQVVSTTPTSDGLLTVELATGKVTIVPLDVSFKSFTVCPSCGAN